MPKNAADVLQQRSDADPERLLARDLRRRETLRAEGLVQTERNRSKLKNPMPHKPDHAGECQQHADDGVAPPARIGEQIGHRAHRHLLAARLLPLLRLLQLA